MENANVLKDIIKSEMTVFSVIPINYSILFQTDAFLIADKMLIILPLLELVFVKKVSI
jgi:hypothetical protein